MKFKGKPPISCPNCGKHILNAGNSVVKNETLVTVVNGNDDYSDYIVFCPFCKKHIGVKHKRPA